MPKKVMIDGKPAMVPDDATEEEINALFPAQRPAQPSTPGAAINPVSSSENPLTQFFQEAGQDLSQGGTRTAVGRLLGQLQGRGATGFSGLNSGVSEGTAAILGSPELGATKALEGVAMTPQHPVAGPLKALSGALQAATIPGLMVGGPASEAAIAAVPSRKFAGQTLNRIAEAAGNAPVVLEDSQAALQRLAELGARGAKANIPGAATQLLERSQATFPMEYSEARDFAENISRLSAEEKMKLVPRVAEQMGNLRTGLHQDIAGALDRLPGAPGQEGLGAEYLNAIREYARAASRNEAIGKVGKNILKYAPYAAAGALGVGGIADAIKRYTR